MKALKPKMWDEDFISDFSPTVVQVIFKEKYLV